MALDVDEHTVWYLFLNYKIPIPYIGDEKGMLLLQLNHLGKVLTLSKVALICIAISSQSELMMLRIQFIRKHNAATQPAWAGNTRQGSFLRI